jgi:hypothetical protein
MKDGAPRAKTKLSVSRLVVHARAADIRSNV